MSTPERTGETAATPPKTPGWAAALFGAFSTTRKKNVPSSVDSGSLDTKLSYGGRESRRPPKVDFALSGTPSPGRISSPLMNGSSLLAATAGLATPTAASGTVERTDGVQTTTSEATPVDGGPAASYPASGNNRMRPTAGRAATPGVRFASRKLQTATPSGRSPWTSSVRNDVRSSKTRVPVSRGPRTVGKPGATVGASKLRKRIARPRYTGSQFLHVSLPPDRLKLDQLKCIEALKALRPALERSAQQEADRTQKLSNFRVKSGTRLLGPHQTAGSRMPSLLPPQDDSEAQQPYRQPQQPTSSASSHATAAAAPLSVVGSTKHKFEEQPLRDRQPSATGNKRRKQTPSAPTVTVTATASTTSASSASKLRLPATATPYRPRAADDASANHANDVDSTLTPSSQPSLGSRNRHMAGVVPKLPERVDYVRLGNKTFDEPHDMEELFTGAVARRGLMQMAAVAIATVPEPADYPEAFFDEAKYLNGFKQEAKDKKKRMKNFQSTGFFSNAFSTTTNNNNAEHVDDDPKSTKRRAIDQAQDWKCTNEVDGRVCGTMNPNDESRCSKCQASRKASSEVTGWGSLFKDMYAGKWKCPVCGVYSDNKFDKCVSCESDRPASAGGSTAANSTTKSAPATTAPGSIKTSGFSFGNSSSGGGNGAKFSFGAVTAPAAPTQDTSTTASSASKFKFEAMPAASKADASTEHKSTSGSFSFGASATSTGTQSSGFKFGAGSATNASTTTRTDKSQSDNKPDSSASTGGGFSFGSTSAPAPAPAATSGFSFGSTSAPAPAPAASGGFSFGGTPAKSDKKASATTKTATGTPSKQSASDAPHSNKRTAVGGFSFGLSKPAPAPDPSDSSASQSKPSTSKPLSATAPVFRFGAAPTSKPAAQSADAKDNGYLAAKAPAPSSSGGLVVQQSSTKTEISSSDAGFGSNAKRSRDDDEPSSKKPVFSFGRSNNADASADAAKPPTSNGGKPENGGASFNVSSGSTTAETPKFTFGSTPSSKPGTDATASSTAPAFSFGAAPSSNSAPPPATSSSSSSNALVPAPSNNSTRAVPEPKVVFGSVPSGEASNSKRSRDGDKADGDFKSSSKPTFTFGSSSSSSSTPAPAFGSAPAAPAFGSAPASAAPSFGSTSGPTSAAPAFGSAPAPAPGGSAPAPAVNGFGAPPSGSTPSFAFGSSAPIPAPASGVFAFGSNSSAQAQPPAAPAFGSSTPAAPMFGSPTPAAPTFGSATPAPTPAPGAPAFNFGTTQPPAASTSGGGFGATTPGFGGVSTNPAPAPAFGSGFGSTAPAPAAFGQPAPGGFGGAPATNTPGGFNAPTGNTAPMFQVGTGSRQTRTPGTGRRRIIRARRPGSSSTRQA